MGDLHRESMAAASEGGGLDGRFTFGDDEDEWGAHESLSDTQNAMEDNDLAALLKQGYFDGRDSPGYADKCDFVDDAAALSGACAAAPADLDVFDREGEEDEF